jgi:hypothetical protein
MAKTGARVHIYGDYDGAGVQKAKKDISTLDTQAKGFSKSFSSSFAGAGAAIGAAFGVGVIGRNVLDFFQSSVTAALADEKAMRSLEIALQNVGAAHQVAPIERFIDALARESGVADDSLRPSFQRLVTATGDVALSQKNLQLAMDVSAGTGRDLEAVTLALARAFTGSTTGLSRLGAGLDANLLKSKDMDKITAALSDRFSGQAAAAAETYQGKINRLNIAVDEGKELIGVALLKAVDDISEAFGGTGGMADAVDTASQAMADFITGVSLTVSPMTNFISKVDKSTGSTGGLVNILGLIAGSLPGIGNAVKLTGLIYDKGVANTAALDKQANALTKLKGEYISSTGAMIGVVSEQGRLRGALSATTVAVVNQFSAMSLLDLKMQDAGTRAIVMANNDAAARRAAAAAAAAAAALVGSSSVAAAKDVFTFKEALAQVNSEGLEKLNANLKVAQDEFDGFRNSVAGGLTGQLSFANAVDDAKEGGTGIVDGITGQAAGIVAFGEQLKLLLSTSLSQESFAAVAALSAERGAALATELLGANGATLIAQLDSSVASVNAIADAVALQSAEKFKGAGVKTAEDTITGFKEYMGKDGIGRKRLMKTMDNLAEAATREVRIDVLVTRSINEIVTRISSGTSSIEARAAGGPVSSGRPYIVGEVGPELFVPSSSGSIVPNNQMGGKVINLTVNAGMGTQGAEVGRQIVDALKAYERRNGSVYVSA